MKARMYCLYGFSSKPRTESSNNGHEKTWRRTNQHTNRRMKILQLISYIPQSKINTCNIFIHFSFRSVCGETQNQGKSQKIKFYLHTHTVSIEKAQLNFFEDSSGWPRIKILSPSLRLIPDSGHVYSVENWFQVNLLRG